MSKPDDLASELRRLLPKPADKREQFIAGLTEELAIFRKLALPMSGKLRDAVGQLESLDEAIKSFQSALAAVEKNEPLLDLLEQEYITARSANASPDDAAAAGSRDIAEIPKVRAWAGRISKIVAARRAAGRHKAAEFRAASNSLWSNLMMRHGQIYGRLPVVGDRGDFRAVVALVLDEASKTDVGGQTITPPGDDLLLKLRKPLEQLFPKPRRGRPRGSKKRTGSHA